MSKVYSINKSISESHLNDAAQNLPKNKKQAGTKSRTKNDENSTERNKQTTGRQKNVNHVDKHLKIKFL